MEEVTVEGRESFLGLFGNVAIECVEYDGERGSRARHRLWQSEMTALIEPRGAIVRVRVMLCAAAHA